MTQFRSGHKLNLPDQEIIRKHGGNADPQPKIAMDNYYKILGITRETSQEELRQQYRYLVKANHPDRFLDPQEKASADEQMKSINAAYSVLSNPEKRAKYDASLPVERPVRRPQQNSGSRSQTGSKDSRDRARQRKDSPAYNPVVSDPRIEYLRSLRVRWQRDIFSVEPFSKKAAQIKGLDDRLTGLIAGLSENDGSASVLLREFDQAVKDFVLFNYALGAEEEYQGLSAKYPKTELQIIAIKPVLDAIRALKSLAAGTNRISPEQANDIEDEIFSDLFDLQKSCQKSGAELVRTRYPKSSNGRQKGPVSSANETNFRPSPQEEPEHYQYQVCAGCGKLSRTEAVEFKRIIGLILFRRVKQVKGEFCIECIEKYFWNFSAVDLFLGWWGIVSLFFTPVYLFSNIRNYLKAWKLRDGSPKLYRIAAISKLAVILGVVGIVGFVSIQAGILWGNGRGSVPAALPTSTAWVSVEPTQEIHFLDLNSTPTVSATATAFACKAWTEISAKDAGLQECVYGVVQNTYFGGEVFNIAFSKSNNSFRMINGSGNPYQDLLGLCVMANGVVQVYNGVPYMEVGDTLETCR